MREHRLYQADWLMRFYGFSPAEIGDAANDGMLDLTIDPKLAWALNSRANFPVDVQKLVKLAVEFCMADQLVQLS